MNKVKEGYKKTLAGEIPEEWGYEELNKLVDKITDGTHKTPTYTEYGVPFLRVTDIQQSDIDWKNVKYISEEEHLELIKRCNPEIGDILYSKNGTIGIPKIIDWENKFSIFVSLCLIKMKKENSLIINKYLEQFLKSDSCMRQIRLRAKQGTVTNLHLEEIRELVIPIPDTKEQEKIALILSTVDEEIDNIDKLIQKNKELKKGLMQQLLTKGIGHTKFKKTEIGEIPEEWGVKELGEICEILDSKRVPLNEKQRADMRGDIPYYGANSIVDYVNDYLFDDKLILMAEDGGNFSEFRDKPIAFYVEGKCWVNNHAHVLRAKDYKSSKWIFYNLVNKDITNIVQGGTRAKLNQKDLRNIVIAFPKVYEQIEIVKILSEVDEIIDKYQNKKIKLEELKKGLMQQLLTGKIRVY
ncbi:restriction endonuclease subunit S [Clostridium tertium]|uniref:restriction endonuclease subunit S n=1 Tax=Clostridium tertium TaxID=1559 RepID=UPI0011588229|nr:restriction endonuclease subunit S [Clostridium tertium]